MIKDMNTPPKNDAQPTTSSAAHTRARAFPDMTDAEIQVFLEERYGAGFAQWFIDELARQPA